MQCCELNSRVSEDFTSSSLMSSFCSGTPSPLYYHISLISSNLDSVSAFPAFHDLDTLEKYWLGIS